MESFLSLFVFHDIYVVSSLVVGITIVVVMLLLFNQKSPESVVKSEVGGSDHIEGALRRVLGEQRWATASDEASTNNGESGEQVDKLEQEVLEKDKTIAELNKQLTQSGGSSEGGAFSGNNSDLMSRIAELEARLQEYEIIEDDIADLSLYKNENDKLKAELTELNKLAERAPEMVINSSDEPAKGKDIVKPSNDDSSGTILAVDPEDSGGEAADLVAEFEKVVNNQTDIAPDDEASSKVIVKGSKDTGKVVMTGDFKSSSDTDIKVHAKLRDISPDSKEEAEVFVAELKSLKKG